ncbi:MAG: hypothetical protein KGZ42_09280 [Melioribacter sp.]|nr:hypothetical protein [Melioribacter sp.]
MKKRLFGLLIILTLLLTPVNVQPVNAAAYGTTFTTSVTYQNVGTGPASISILFYQEASGTPITINRPQLAPLAGTSIFVGSLTEISSGFKGSAVMQSDQPLVATLVQVPPTGSSVKVRPLSNGFSSGASVVGIPTVLKNTFGTHSTVVVQNIDSVGADLTFTFTPVSGSPVVITHNNLPSGAAKYYDLGQLSQLGTSFNGALLVSSRETGTTNAGNIVATAMEMNITGNGAYAFEGTAQSGNKIYMPSALCRFTAAQQTTAYAVQNTSAGIVNVTVMYSSGNNDGPFPIPAGGKRSFDGCAVNGTGFIGSATIESTGGNIVAVGKVFGGGLSTAFLGFTDGAPKIALPYVRYTQSQWTNGVRQRAFIAIQNVGTTNLATGQVTVKYYGKDGVLIGTHTLGAIAAGAKVNSNASNIGTAGNEFGYYTDGSFGGSAIIQGPVGSKLAAVVRVQTYVSASVSAGEDYTGIPIQ